eukprot:Phypoly_transcript_13211.p1 GENE.Phypoly_transcript_13211~~Phypoly_transcript_13211.p1  ORF type:complete len:162 (+),score=13.50 Phypoly_transcript_13211:445-930(+)
MHGGRSMVVAAIASGANVFASSEHNSEHSVKSIRLNSAGMGAGSHSWCAKTLDSFQWVGVGFDTPKKVTAVATQGRGDYAQWVEEYIVKYSLNGIDWFVAEDGKVFTGNSDQRTVVKNDFITPVTARTIQVCPLKWHGRINLVFLFFFSFFFFLKKILLRL